MNTVAFRSRHRL